MYLVEIEAGRETLYESVAALASAIRRGDVGPQSRIFHRASSTWISITVHPEYRKAAAAWAREPLPPLARKQWTFFGLEADGREVEEIPVARAEPPAPPTPAPTEAAHGLRGLLGRAFRSRSASPKASKPAGS
jgi:hypothetical protein